MDGGELQYLGFVGGKLDRAAQRRTDAAWLTARICDPTSRFVRISTDRALIDRTQPEQLQIAYCGFADVEEAINESGAVLLGVDDADRAVFAAQAPALEADEKLPGAPEIAAIDLRSLMVQGVLAGSDLALLAQARTLLHWHQRHGFCANCGKSTHMTDGGYRRRCDACEADHFPRTDPVAIMAVVRNGELLLGRGHNFPESVYSVLAGFIEPGESIEEATRREIFEEAGIRLGAVRYHSSQPWPFPANLMIGVIGEAASGSLTVDPHELEDCRWFSREETLAMLENRHPDGLKAPPRGAIAYHLLKAALA